MLYLRRGEMQCLAILVIFGAQKVQNSVYKISQISLIAAVLALKQVRHEIITYNQKLTRKVHFSESCLLNNKSTSSL